MLMQGRQRIFVLKGWSASLATWYRSLHILTAMRVFGTIISGILTVSVGVSAQDTFEAPDFNVTDALIGNGVNVSAIPELANLVVRSSSSGCSIAVSMDAVPPFNTC
jgi:uncharacterized MnhB-related membrane protein